MIEKIGKYIDYLKNKHNVIAGMVYGSYVTNRMGPNSDIDLFFIWLDEFTSLRGREYFEGLEFEYFISPEWKFYDRLRTDTAAIQIYANAKILFDPENKLAKIQKTALDLYNNYMCNLSLDLRKDYAFWLETISKDGEDLYDKGEYTDFLYLTDSSIEKMSNLICMLNNKLPVYKKYGSSEIKKVDQEYGELLDKFILTNYFNRNKKFIWKDMCGYLQKKLGDIDITNYEKYQRLINEI